MINLFGSLNCITLLALLRHSENFFPLINRLNHLNFILPFGIDDKQSNNFILREMICQL